MPTPVVVIIAFIGLLFGGAGLLAIVMILTITKWVIGSITRLVMQALRIK